MTIPRSPADVDNSALASFVVIVRAVGVSEVVVEVLTSLRATAVVFEVTASSKIVCGVRQQRIAAREQKEI